jgi:16S rRNA processing protein RimM
VTTSASSDDELIELAAIMRAHGLRGELLLKPFNPDSTLLLSVERVLLKGKTGVVTSYQVEGARIHSDHVLLTLANVLDRDHADTLRGSLVCVTRAELPALEDGEYYLVDLVGLEARDAEGKPIGPVIDVIEYPSANCLAVQCEDGVREVPNIERYVLEVDVPNGFVRVEHLEEIDPLKVAEVRVPKAPRPPKPALPKSER